MSLVQQDLERRKVGVPLNQRGDWAEVSKGGGVKFPDGVPNPGAMVIDQNVHILGGVMAGQMDLADRFGRKCLEIDDRVEAEIVRQCSVRLWLRPRDNLLVTEVRESLGTVGQSAVTSYQLKRDGILKTITGYVPDAQTAACWIAITPDGRFAYVVDTASAVISGYQLGYNGELSLLGNGVTAQTPRAFLDNAFTRNGRYMYDVTGGGVILGYQVEADGSLTLLNPTATAPPGSRGLVAEEVIKGTFLAVGRQRGILSSPPNWPLGPFRREA
jgi:hypothetical protein